MRNRTLRTTQGLIIFGAALALLATPALECANANLTTEDKIKEGIDSAACTLKKGVEKCGDKIEDVQNYFRKQFHETVVIGPATVTDVKFNGHHLAAVVKPGERIEGELKCHLDKDKIKDIKYHRLIIGFEGAGAQTSIVNGVGYLAEKDSKGKFVLIAPSEPGLYKVRFRPVESYSEGDALKKWYDENGLEPGGETTMGLIYVKA